MKRNRSKYNRSLNIRGILRLAFVAVLVAGFGCGFVHVRNQHVAKGGEKGALEREIEELKKEIDLINSRVAAAMEPEAMKVRLRIEASDLIQIGHNYDTVGAAFVERMAMSNGSGYEYP